MILSLVSTVNKKRNIQPSCNIDEGFDEAITSHMSTIAYKEKRKVFWDEVNEIIV